MSEEMAFAKAWSEWAISLIVLALAVWKAISETLDKAENRQQKQRMVAKMLRVSELLLWIAGSVAHAAGLEGFSLSLWVAALALQVVSFLRPTTAPKRREVVFLVFSALAVAMAAINALLAKIVAVLIQLSP